MRKAKNNGSPELCAKLITNGNSTQRTLGVGSCDPLWAYAISSEHVSEAITRQRLSSKC